MEKKDRKGPPDMMPKVYIGGVHYAPFERLFDKRLEGADNWHSRVSIQIHTPTRATP